MLSIPRCWKGLASLLAALVLTVSCGDGGSLDVASVADDGTTEDATSVSEPTDGPELTRQASSELSDVRDVDSALAFSLTTASRYVDRDLIVELSAEKGTLGEDFARRFEELHDMEFAQTPRLFTREAWLSVARPLDGSFTPPRGRPGRSLERAEGRLLLSIFDPATTEQHVGLYLPEDLERLIGRSIDDLAFVRGGASIEASPE